MCAKTFNNIFDICNVFDAWLCSGCFICQWWWWWSTFDRLLKIQTGSIPYISVQNSSSLDLPIYQRIKTVTFVRNSSSQNFCELVVQLLQPKIYCKISDFFNFSKSLINFWRSETIFRMIRLLIWSHQPFKNQLLTFRKVQIGPKLLFLDDFGNATDEFRLKTTILVRLSRLQ